jgi:hypothetical protein
MNKVQKSLITNAIFSSLSGFILILMHHSIANVFEIRNRNIFWIIGIALLYFATTIVYEIFKQRPKAILWIIIQDFVWVIGSLFILIFRPYEISKAGYITISAVAFIVLLMALNQSKALKQLKRS